MDNGNNKVHIMWTCIPGGKIPGRKIKNGKVPVKFSVCPSFKFPENISGDCKKTYNEIISDWPKMVGEIKKFKIIITNEKDQEKIDPNNPINANFNGEDLNSKLWKKIFGQFSEVFIKQEKVKEKEPAKEFAEKPFVGVRSFSLNNIGQICSEYKQAMLNEYMQMQENEDFKIASHMKNVNKIFLNPLTWKDLPECPSTFEYRFESSNSLSEKRNINEEYINILLERDLRRLGVDSKYLPDWIVKILKTGGSMPSLKISLYNTIENKINDNNNNDVKTYKVSSFLSYLQHALFFHRVPNLYKYSHDKLKGDDKRMSTDEKDYTFTERIALLNNHPILFGPLGLKIEICFDIDDKILENAEKENLCIKVSPEWEQEQKPEKGCCIGSYSPSTYFDEGFLTKGRTYTKLSKSNNRLIKENIVNLQIKNTAGDESLFELQTEDHVGYVFKMGNHAKTKSNSHSFIYGQCSLDTAGIPIFTILNTSMDIMNVFDIKNGDISKLSNDDSINYLLGDCVKMAAYNRYFTGTFLGGKLNGQDYHVKISGDIRKKKNKYGTTDILITIGSTSPADDSPASARTCGISLVKTDRSSDILEYKERIDSWHKGGKDFDNLKYYADDLILGYVPEVYKKNPNQPGTGKWFSLTRREERYEADGLEPIVKQTDGILRLPILKSTDSTDANPNPPEDLYVNESLFQWNGESLGLSKVEETYPQETPNDGLLGSKLKVTYSSIPKSLPRLRYTKEKYPHKSKPSRPCISSFCQDCQDSEKIRKDRYYVRLKPVYLDGSYDAGHGKQPNKKELKEELKYAIATPYYRCEELSPPQVLLTKRIRKSEVPTRGLKQLVVTEDYRQDVRIIVPPSTSMQQVITHGMLDNDEVQYPLKSGGFRQIQLDQKGNFPLIRMSEDDKQIYYNYGSSDFYVDEFEPPFNIQILCKVINNDNYNVPLKANINTIDWLNELLKVSEFYDLIIYKKKNIVLPEYIKDLVKETFEYRSKKGNEYAEYDKLTFERKNNIRRLNRYLLEEIYQKETPKTLKTDNSGDYLPIALEPYKKFIRQSPYCPDPLAVRLHYELRNFPGEDDKQKAKLKGEISFYAFGERWPRARTIEIKLIRGAKNQKYPRIHTIFNTISVYLPPAFTADLVISSALDEKGDDIHTLSLYQMRRALGLVKSKKDENEEMSKLRNGQVPLLSPPEIIKLISCTKKPLVAPEISTKESTDKEPIMKQCCPPPVTQDNRDIKVTRDEYNEKDAKVELRYLVDVKSTGQAQLMAKWEELTFDAKNNKHTILSLNKPVDQPMNLSYAWKRDPVDIQWIRDVQITSSELKDKLKEQIKIKDDGQKMKLIHAFETTKYVAVEYVIEGTSQPDFVKSYQQKKNDDKNTSDIDALSISKEFKLTSTKPVIRHILNTGTPKDPNIDSVCYLVNWEQKISQEGTDRQEVFESNRKGNGVRIYFNLSETTGKGELFGIVTKQAVPGGLQVESPDIDKEIKITQAAMDPIWNAVPVQQYPTEEHIDYEASKHFKTFCEKVYVPDPELNSDQKPVTLAVYEPEYEDAEKRSGRQFIDVIFKDLNSYFVFVKMAVLRYQPNSIEDPKAKYSNIVTVNSQLLPDRSTIVKRDSQDKYALIVEVRGLPNWPRKYTYGNNETFEGGNDYEIEVLRKVEFGGKEAGWVKDEENIKIEITQKEIRIPQDNNASRDMLVLFQAKLRWKKQLGPRSLLVREFETFPKSRIDAPSKRLVYADVLEL